jgi:hypothetical protein
VPVKKSNYKPKALESPQPPTADEIADLADNGEDISRFFTNAGRMTTPIAPETKKPAAIYMRYDIFKR